MFKRKIKIRIIILQPVDGATDGATRQVICPASVYTIILLKSVGVNKLQATILARSSRETSQTESISFHEFSSQFGPAIFLYAKNTKNYREYRVARTNVYLNEALTDHCSPATTYMSSDNVHEQRQQRL